MKCKHMGNSGICYILSTADHFEHCVQGPCPHEAPMTNADRIRAMSDEELEEYIVGLSYRPHALPYMPGMYVCSDGYGFEDKGEAVAHEKVWLKQSAEED